MEEIQNNENNDVTKNDYEEKINKQNEQIEQMQKELGELSSENKTLQQKVSQSEQEFTNFREGLTKDFKEVFNYTDEISKIDKDFLTSTYNKINENMLSNLKSNQDFMKICELLNVDAQIVTKGFENILKNLEKKNSDSENLIKEYEDNINTLKKEYEEKLSNLEKSKVESLHSLEEKLKELNEAVGQKDKTIETQLDTINSNESEIIEKDNKIKELQKEFDLLKEKAEISNSDNAALEGLRNELDLAKKENTRLNETCNSQIEKIKELQFSNINSTNEISELKEDLEKLEATLSEKQGQITNLEGKVKELTDKADLLQNEVNSVKQQKTEFEKNKEQDILTLNEEISNKDFLITNLENKVKQLEIDIENIKNDTGNTNSENTDLNNKIETLQTEIKNLNSNLANEKLNFEEELKIKETHLNQKTEEYEKRIQILTDELNRFKTIDEVNKENEKEENEILLEKQNKIAELNELISQKNNQIEDHIKELKLTCTKADKLEQELQTKSEQLSKLTEDHKLEVICLKESLYKQKFESEVEVEKLKDQLLVNNQTGNNESKLDDVKGKLKELFTQLKHDLSNYDYLIDKRIIGNILLNYFDKSANSKIKDQVLETLSHMLEYNNDDRKKLGLNALNNGTASSRMANTSYYETLVVNLDNILEFI
jgi:chromosome segregation ATPase